MHSSSQLHFSISGKAKYSPSFSALYWYEVRFKVLRLRQMNQVFRIIFTK